MATSRSMQGKIKHILNIPLKSFGFELIRTRSKAVNPAWYDRLKHMKDLGFTPNVIFDCGAYIGEWTVKASEIFDNAQFLLIEPNTIITEETQKHISGISPQPILLKGIAVEAEMKPGYLNVWANAETSMEGSSLLAHIQGEAQQKIPIEIVPLDSISAQYHLKPDLVKLDLQGAELSALKGAQHILETAEAFMIEFGVLDAYDKRTTPRELIDMMYDHHYCLYDIVDLCYRPYDMALHGGDFLFVKCDSPLKHYQGYR